MISILLMNIISLVKTTLFVVMFSIGISLMTASVKIITNYFDFNNLRKTLKGISAGMISFSIGTLIIAWLLTIVKISININIT